MKTAWVLQASEVWRSFEQPRWELYLRSLPILTNSANWAKHTVLFPGQQTTVGGAYRIATFKNAWEILWHLCLVHGTIYCWHLHVNSKWHFFWDHSCTIFFLPPPCQSAGLHYFLKIKVRKNSADTFLTFPPYKHLYHLQYQQNWVPSLRNRKWLLLMTDFFFYVDDWHRSSAISSYGLTLKSERSWSFICLSQVSKLGRRIRMGKTLKSRLSATESHWRGRRMFS